MSEYPSEWEVVALGEVAEVVGGGTPSRDIPAFWGDDHYWITPSEVVAIDGKTASRSKEKISDLGLASSGAKLHPPGTILMTSRASIGFAAIAEKEICTNQGFQSLRCGEELDNWFALHQIRHRRAELQQLAAGSTFLEISGSNVRSFPFAVPPLPEQKKIAEILSGIDNLINSLTQQKQKLDASKAALSKKLISGLQGPRKESLYGQIPEHWNESTLGEVVGADNLQTGPFGSQLHAHEYTAEGIPVVMPQDMRKCRVVTEKIARITPERAQSLEKHKVTPGDILFSRRGDIGRHAIISHNESGWICGTGCLRARTNGAINPFFLSELLMHRYALEWLNANAVGQTMLNLNTGILSGLPVVVPPKGEQDMIASALNSISNRSEKISDKILFAQNLKASLSTVLLSGRKRVSV